MFNGDVLVEGEIVKRHYSYLFPNLYHTNLYDWCGNRVKQQPKMIAHVRNRSRYPWALDSSVVPTVLFGLVTMCNIKRLVKELINTLNIIYILLANEVKKYKNARVKRVKCHLIPILSVKSSLNGSRCFKSGN